MITNEQRKLYWANLNAIFKVRSSSFSLEVRSSSFSLPPGNVGSNDTFAPSAQDACPARAQEDLDSFRAAFHAQHHLPASTKAFTKENFDTFLAACAAILKPNNLQPQLRAIDQPKTRFLHKILVEQAAQLKALGKPDPSATIAQISKDKFRGRLPADLSDSHRSVFGSQFSELEMLRNTVARVISQLRQQKGWTVHELLWQAGLGQTCPCAACRAASKPKPRRNRREEILTNAPF